MQKLSLIFFVTEDWYFCSHRFHLALAAKKAGFDVSVITHVNAHAEQIESAGIKLIPLELSRRGINPLSEFRVLYQLILIYRVERPNIVHNVALKPVLYGGLAACFANIPCVVNALPGLGIIFSSQLLKVRLLRPMVTFLFRLLLNRRNSRVILQNPDDVRLMCSNRIVTQKQIVLIRGSGVDTRQFIVHPEQAGVPVVTLASRLLWDKGVGEFVEAAKKLRLQGIVAKFVLVGRGDKENPAAISEKQLKIWHEEGNVEWWGQRDDMPKVMAQSHIICLPSYYGEGVPKVLIEAASSGRPIVTTDSPGCREIVQDGKNGFLVPLRNVEILVKMLKVLIESPSLRKKMGEYGRALVEKGFTLKKVNGETIAVYKELAKCR